VNEKGEFDGGLAMVMDITEQKSARVSIAFSEQRFRSLIENSQDLLTLIQPDAIVTYISPSAERILGYSLAETTGLNAFNIIHRDDVSAAYLALQNALENPGKPIPLEFRNRRKDGGFIWLQGTLINMLDVPSVNQIVANTRDITERKKIEDQTKKNALLLAEAQHIAKYGNWNFDVVNNRLTWSKELYNIFGIEKGVFNKTLDSFFELVDKADRDRVLETYGHTQKTGQPFDMEYHVTIPSGEKRVIHDIGYAEHDLSGKVLRLYGTAQNITERKRAEEELVKEKRLSDSIINSLTGIFYLLDIRGNFLRWNKNMETVLGYSAVEISRLNAIDVFKYEEREFVLRKIEEVFSQGMAEAEASVITKSGNQVPYYFKASAVDYDGNTCLIGMAIDVTELKKAEAVIKESEAKYRAFFENSTDAILILDAKGQVLEANPSAAVIFGIDESVICTMNAFDLFDPANEEIQKILKELHQNGKSKGELTMLRKDGTQFPCEVAVVTYKDSFNEIRTSKIIRDITERKNAEEQLLKINERYKLATRATSNAIWDWNLLTDEIHWSEGYRLTFGYPFSNATQGFRTLKDRIYPPDYKRVSEKILNVLKGNNGDYWEDEYRFIKPDGTVAYVYDRGNLVFDRNGKPCRFVGAMQDITTKREIENERELLINELMKSNNDLKQFTFITSHNLRSPLSNIAAILNLIDYSSLDPHNFKLLQLLKESGKQLGTTIEDLTNILIIKNSVNVKISSINLESMFREIVKTFLIELENVSGSIVTEFNIRDINFHKTYIESIFINLISNAIKYRSLHRNLILTIVSFEDARGNFVLTFSDNGSGIDLNMHKDKVFGLYQRFNSQVEGHGLGLFIIKSQITALGGSIEIESEVDKGTKFSITFTRQGIS
jgi:PAS domain S-box-containing protein